MLSLSLPEAILALGLSVALALAIATLKPPQHVHEHGLVYAITDKGRGPLLGAISGPMRLEGPYQVWSDGRGRTFRTRAAVVIESEGSSK